jgi:hypothetical protein
VPGARERVLQPAGTDHGLPRVLLCSRSRKRLRVSTPCVCFVSVVLFPRPSSSICIFDLFVLSKYLILAAIRRVPQSAPLRTTTSPPASCLYVSTLITSTPKLFFICSSKYTILRCSRSSLRWMTVPVHPARAART